MKVLINFTQFKNNQHSRIRSWQLRAKDISFRQRWLVSYSFLFFYFSTLTTAFGQTCSSTSSVMAEWNFDTKTVQCNGDNTSTNRPYGATWVGLKSNTITYCPNFNSGCAQTIFGSRGFQNTGYFANSICLSGFYGGCCAPGWDPTSTTFDPEIAGNLYIKYKIPQGKSGKITGFSLFYGQKQESPIVFYSSLGVGVYRNGVLIYTSTQEILAKHTTLSFSFPEDDKFNSDGSKKVEFEIVFGLVNKLIPHPVVFDDLKVYGTCGDSPSPTANISSVTCSPTGANIDGKITISNFGATDRFDFNTGTSYTGGHTYATAITIPGGGSIVSNLINPTTTQDYTVRVFTAAGCTYDLPLLMLPVICPNCIKPTAVLNFTSATCTGTSVNANASIAITSITNGDKIGFSAGSSYTGALYNNAQTISGDLANFNNLPNPASLSQTYTVRIFNGGDDCFIDYPVVINEADCGCKKVGVEIIASDSDDPDSSPGNSMISEDDFASYEVCKGTGYIDLKLTKTVSPTNGTTCPAGTNFVWTLTLTNEGTMTATDIQVADILPDNLILLASNPSVGSFAISSGWLVPSLGASSSATLSLTTKALVAGSYQNCAWVNGAFPDNDPDSAVSNDYTADEDDDECASITVTGPNVPSVVKEFSPIAGGKPNVPFRLTIKLYNNASTPITLTDAFEDILPSTPGQMTVASVPNLISDISGVDALSGSTAITIPVGSVLLPGLNQIMVDVLGPVAGKYCNTILAGELKTSNCDNVLSSESCIELDPNNIVAPLISKSMSPTNIQNSQNSTLNITVENRNTGNITLLQDFKDVLPDGLILAGSVSGTCTNISTFGSTNEVGLTEGSVIVPGICTISVPVTSATAGTYCNQIPMNALIGNVSTGSGDIMTGNEDYAVSCLTVTANPCTTVSSATLSPATVNVLPGASQSFATSATGTSSNSLYRWNTNNIEVGSFSNQGRDISVLAPSTPGTYTITVTVDNKLTGYGTCESIATAAMIVGSGCAASQTHTTPVCNNNNTGGNATDDYFSFSVTGTVTDGSGNYVVKIGAWTSPSIVSGQAVSIVGNSLSGNPSLPANGSSITVRVEDATDSACFTTFTVSSAACSTCPSPNCGTVTVQKN